MDEQNQGAAGTQAEQGTESKGIVGEIVDGLHKVEAAVEHLIHPGAEGSAAAPGESLPVSTGISAALGASAASSDASASASPSVPVASTQPPSGEPGSLAAAPLVPNAPASGAENQSEASSGASALDASGASANTAVTKPAAAHPALTWLNALEKELATNPFAGYARELIAKIRATL